MRFDIVINDLCALAWTTKRIAMTSDGSPWRPMVHIEDICTAIVCASKRPWPPSTARCSTSAQNCENYRVREIAQIVADVFPGCELSTGTAGADNRSYRVSFDKICEPTAGVPLQMDRAPGRRGTAVALRADRVLQGDLRVPCLYPAEADPLPVSHRADRRRFFLALICGSSLCRSMAQRWYGSNASTIPAGFFARTFCARGVCRSGLPTAALQTSVSYNERAGNGARHALPVAAIPARRSWCAACVGGCTMCCWIFGRSRRVTCGTSPSRWMKTTAMRCSFRPAWRMDSRPLAAHSEVQYQMTDVYARNWLPVVRWNDPAFAIRWPIAETS